MKSVLSLRAFVCAAAIAAMSLSTTAQAQEKKEAKKADKPVARAVATPAKVRPLSVNIDLLSKTNIAGTLTDATTLKCELRSELHKFHYRKWLESDSHRPTTLQQLS